MHYIWPHVTSRRVLLFSLKKLHTFLRAGDIYRARCNAFPPASFSSYPPTARANFIPPPCLRCLYIRHAFPGFFPLPGCSILGNSLRNWIMSERAFNFGEEYNRQRRRIYRVPRLMGAVASGEDAPVEVLFIPGGILFVAACSYGEKVVNL